MRGPPFWVFDGRELWLGGSAFAYLNTQSGEWATQQRGPPHATSLHVFNTFTKWPRAPQAMSTCKQVSRGDAVRAGQAWPSKQALWTSMAKQAGTTARQAASPYASVACCCPCPLQVRKRRRSPLYSQGLAATAARPAGLLPVQVHRRGPPLLGKDSKATCKHTVQRNHNTAEHESDALSKSCSSSGSAPP